MRVFVVLLTHEIRIRLLVSLKDKVSHDAADTVNEVIYNEQGRRKRTSLSDDDHKCPDNYHRSLIHQKVE